VPLVPDGRIDDVIERGVTDTEEIAIDVLAVAVCTGLLESVTVTEKLLETLADVGVPDITPELADRERPAGNWPDDTDHVYGAVPPAAWSAWE